MSAGSLRRRRQNDIVHTQEANSRMVRSCTTVPLVQAVRPPRRVDTDGTPVRCVVLTAEMGQKRILVMFKAGHAYFMHSMLSWNATVLQQHAAVDVVRPVY